MKRTILMSQDPCADVRSFSQKALSGYRTRQAEERAPAIVICDGRPILLSRDQCDALLAFKRAGPGGTFDPSVMSELFRLGLLDVPSGDHRMALTELGRLAHRQLTTST